MNYLQYPCAVGNLLSPIYPKLMYIHVPWCIAILAQSNTTQHNPTHPNPIQSNPVQSNPIQPDSRCLIFSFYVFFALDCPPSPPPPSVRSFVLLCCRCCPCRCCCCPRWWSWRWLLSVLPFFCGRYIYWLLFMLLLSLRAFFFSCCFFCG